MILGTMGNQCAHRNYSSLLEVVIVSSHDNRRSSGGRAQRCDHNVELGIRDVRLPLSLSLSLHQFQIHQDPEPRNPPPKYTQNTLKNTLHYTTLRYTRYTQMCVQYADL